MPSRSVPKSYVRATSFAGSLLRKEFWLAGLLITGIGVAPVYAADVWVDFTTDFHDGDNGAPNGVADWIDELNELTQAESSPLITVGGVNRNTYTASERAQIETNILAELRRVYQGTNLNFVTEQPSGQHDVLYMGRGYANGSLGSAQGDFANLNTLTYSANNLANPTDNPGSVPKVSVANFGSFLEPGFDTVEETIAELSSAFAGTAAHELGHTFGLFHHFAYSAEGITPDNLNNTGGLQNQHIIATGSTGLNEAERESPTRTLSPFSQVIVDIAGGLSSRQGDSGRENTPIVANPIFSDDTELQGGDAGDTFATAQTLFFDTGTLSGSEISFIEGDLDVNANDVDLFRFDIFAEANFSAHVFSERLFFSNEFDATVSLFDAAGNELGFSDDVSWQGDFIVLDESGQANGTVSSEDDPFLFNIMLDPGTYFIEVASTEFEVSDIAVIGDQYALVTSLQIAAVPEPSTTVLLTLGFGVLLGGRRRRRMA